MKVKERNPVFGSTLTCKAAVVETVPVRQNPIWLVELDLSTRAGLRMVLLASARAFFPTICIVRVMSKYKYLKTTG